MIADLYRTDMTVELTGEEVSRELANRLLRKVDTEIILRGLSILPIRAEEPPQGANAKHAAAKVLRTARLQSVANWLQEQVDKQLAHLKDALANEVELHARSQGWSTGGLFSAAEKIITKTFKKLGKQAEGWFADLHAAMTAKAAKDLGEHHGVEVSVNTAQSTTDTPVLGAPLREHFALLGQQASFKFRAAVRQGLEANDTVHQIAERIKASEAVMAAEVPAEIDKALKIKMRLGLDSTSNSINKVIQAAITAFAGDADFEGGPPAGGGVGKQMGWQWVAVMDANTCPTCEFYDGHRWDADFQPVGDDGVEYPGDPGLHFNCRCTRLPVDLETEPVPDQSFDDYLAQFSRSEQEQAFGAENLKAYRRGDIPASALIGQKDNLMTLEAFKEAEQ